MLLLLSLVCKQTLVLDLGGKYMKGAIVHDDGTFTNIRNFEDGSVAIPCAITSDFEGPISMENIRKALKIDGCSIGSAAVRLIQKNCTRGIPFLWATFGKDIEYLKKHHKFYGIDSAASFNGLPMSWYVCRMLAQLQGEFGEVDEIVVIQPFSSPIYMRSQLQVLGSFLNKRLVNLIDTQVFGWVASRALQPKLRHGERAVVIVIDVGAFSLKVQLLRFMKDPRAPIVSTGFLAGFISEDAGLERVAYRMSVAKDVKRQRAVKRLETMTEPDSVFREEFLKLMGDVRECYPGKIQYVQVVGGGARYKWVQSVLKEGVDAPMLFNVNHITGLVDMCAGIVAVGVENEACVTYPLYLQYGDTRLAIFMGNNKASHNLAFPFGKERMLHIVTDQKYIPMGYDTTMYMFKVDMNGTSFGSESPLVFSATNKAGSPILEGAVLCSSRECKDVKLVNMYKGETAAILDMAKAVDGESVREIVEMLNKKLKLSMDVNHIMSKNGTIAQDMSALSWDL